jgi:two-component system, chemotaxis family, sensor kinase CheA
VIVNIALTPQEKKVFNKDLSHHLNLIEKSLIALEIKFEEEVLNQLFRSFHTIKGNAGMIDYTALQNISGEVENILQKIKKKGFSLTEKNIEDLFLILDYIKKLAKYLAKSSFEIDDEEHSSFINLAQELLKSTKKNIDEKETQSTKETINFQDYIMLNCYLDNKAKMPNVTYFQTLKIITDLNINFFSEPNLDEIKNGKEYSFLKIYIHVQTNIELIESFYEKLKNINSILYLKITYPLKISKTNNEYASKNISNSKEELLEININILEIDKLINQLGEILIHRNQFFKSLEKLENKYPFDNELKCLSESSSKILKSSNELQSQLLNIRSIPLHTILDKYHRFSRELAKKLNKKINLEIIGTEVRLDRVIISKLNDMLIHIIRNSIDHGIEEVDKREKQGKNSTGLIKIHVEQKNNKAIFVISDDGKGIDSENIKKKIIEKNIITKEEANNLKTEQIISYIFHPEFSTKEDISDISGRGVGMDVVKNTIQKLGGNIVVNSQKNIGTTFTITLPLTLAIIKGLLIELSNKILIIPITYIEEIIDIKEKYINIISNTPHIHYRGDIIPIILLKNLLFDSNENITKDTKGIVVTFSDNKVVFIADKILQEQEIVIKNIDFVGKLYYLIHSATILSTGHVGLILDMYTLFNELRKKYFLHYYENTYL